MPILKEIKENLKTVANIEMITKSYQEIANLMMNKIQHRVLDNREFIEALSGVYNLAKRAYYATAQKAGSAEKMESIIKKSGQRVVVFLSGNERFYGTLILDIWGEILNYLSKNRADLAITGRMGKYLAERSGFGHKMFYFELDDNSPTTKEVVEIVDFLKDYQEIIIFHGKFQSILSQKVVQTNISGTTVLQEESPEVKDYLFEPSAKSVLEFFERELTSAFFNEAILEHSLSRYAARMIAMYHATENAKKAKRMLEIEQSKVERQLLNKEQIELFGPLEALAKNK